MNFKHETKIQIRFKDIDRMGHVNNANHMTYIELARTQYFKDVVGETIDWTKTGIILARVTIDYKMPILFNDDTWVKTRCSRLGQKSFDLEAVIVKKEGDKETVLATTKAVLVCFDYETNQTIFMPEPWREKVYAYEPEMPVEG